MRDDPTQVEFEDGELIPALRQIDATSPERARALHELPPVSAQEFKMLLDAGIIREGAPGTFYLYDGSFRSILPDEPGPRRVVRLLIVVAIVLVVIVVPLLFLRATP